jgi:hypothetical protein
MYDSSLSEGVLADGVAGIAGLTLSNSMDTKIIENAFSNEGIAISGSDFVHFIADVENNTVNGKPLCYYRGQDNFTVSENLGQLIIVDCRNVTIEDVGISHTDFGVQICYSASVTIRNSVITDCQYGVGILSTSNTVICGNTIANNSVGLFVESGDFLGSTVYHNNFVNNLLQTSCPETASNYVWDNGCEGNYWSNYNGTDLYSGPYQNETGSDGIGDIPYVIDAYNRDNYPLMKQLPWDQHDIGIMGLSMSKSVYGQGYPMNISIMMFNYGEYTETFSVTVYANTTVIGTQTVNNLLNRTTAVLVFTLNTTGVAYGNYTICGYAEPVLGEADTADNNCTCIIPVHIGVPGDVSGPTVGVYDGTTNMRDINYTIILFNTKPSSPNWNPNADVNGDAVVNMRDIQIEILHFNQNE